MGLLSTPHHKVKSTEAIKEEGNKFKFYPRGLNITWGKDSRYWKLPRKDEPMDEDNVAELKQVAWLEVTGSTPKNVVFGKKYKVGFRVSLRPYAFGWEGREVYIMAKIGKGGTFSFKKVNFEGKPLGTRFDIPVDNLVITVPPKETAPSDCKLYFGMYEVWSRRWKGGLTIHHAFVEMID